MFGYGTTELCLKTSASHSTWLTTSGRIPAPSRSSRPTPGPGAELQGPGGEPIRVPLACWALVEEDNGRGEWNVRYVVGMIGGAGDAVRLEAANSKRSFRGYRFDS